MAETPDKSQNLASEDFLSIKNALCETPMGTKFLSEYVRQNGQEENRRLLSAINLLQSAMGRMEKKVEIYRAEAHLGPDASLQTINQIEAQANYKTDTLNKLKAIEQKLIALRNSDRFLKQAQNATREITVAGESLQAIARQLSGNNFPPQLCQDLNIIAEKILSASSIHELAQDKCAHLVQVMNETQRDITALYDHTNSAKFADPAIEQNTAGDRKNKKSASLAKSKTLPRKSKPKAIKIIPNNNKNTRFKIDPKRAEGLTAKLTPQKPSPQAELTQPDKILPTISKANLTKETTRLIATKAATKTTTKVIDEPATTSAPVAADTTTENTKATVPVQVAPQTDIPQTQQPITKAPETAPVSTAPVSKALVSQEELDTKPIKEEKNAQTEVELSVLDDQPEPALITPPAVPDATPPAVPQAAKSEETTRTAEIKPEETTALSNPDHLHDQVALVPPPLPTQDQKQTSNKETYISFVSDEEDGQNKSESTVLETSLELINEAQTNKTTEQAEEESKEKNRQNDLQKKILSSSPTLTEALKQLRSLGPNSNFVRNKSTPDMPSTSVDLPKNNAPENGAMKASNNNLWTASADQGR